MPPGDVAGDYDAALEAAVRQFKLERMGLAPDQLPVLSACSAVKVAPSVYYVCRKYRVLGACIPAGSDHRSISGDPGGCRIPSHSLAGSTVIGYLEQLLVERPSLVLTQAAARRGAPP